VKLQRRNLLNGNLYNRPEIRNHFRSFVLAKWRAADGQFFDVAGGRSKSRNCVADDELMRGGGSAPREAKLMVSEKIRAAFEASARLMAGASGDEIIHRYRRHVAANGKRLGKLNSGRSRNGAVKLPRRRRK
jgi:hypothetical protein